MYVYMQGCAKMLANMKWYFATHFRLLSYMRFATGAGFLGTGHGVRPSCLPCSISRFDVP